MTQPPALCGTRAPRGARCPLWRVTRRAIRRAGLDACVASPACSRCLRRKHARHGVGPRCTAISRKPCGSRLHYFPRRYCGGRRSTISLLERRERRHNDVSLDVPLRQDGLVTCLHADPRARGLWALGAHALARTLFAIGSAAGCACRSRRLWNGCCRRDHSPIGAAA